MSEFHPAPAIQRLVGEASRLDERAGNHAYAFRLPAEVATLDRLNDVYRSFGRVHEILRTRIERDTDGKWRCAIVGEEFIKPIETYSLGRLENPETIAQIGAIARRPMRPAEPPHYDLMLFDCAGEKVLVTRGHHIVLDGASRLRMMQQLVSHEAHASDTPQELASDTFRRLGTWEDSILKSGYTSHILARAERAMARHGGRQVIGFPPGKPYPASRLATTRALSRQDSDHVLAACQASGISLFGLGLSCFSKALGPVSRQASHLVCIPHSIRYRLRMPTRIGNFMDYLFVEVSADPDDPRGPRDATSAVLAAARDFLPLRCVTEAVVGGSDPAVNPFLRITAADLTGGDDMPSALLAMPGDADEADPARLETIAIPTGTIPFEMQDTGVLICRRNGEVRWRIGGRADVYSAEVLEGVSRRVEKHLQEFLALPAIA